MGNSIRRLVWLPRGPAGPRGSHEVFSIRRSMMPRSMSAKRTIQSPLSVSAMPTGSPFSVSADEDQVAAPLDGPVGAHPAHGVPGIVPGLVQAFGVRPRRGPVERRRRLLAKRLVGTVVVEVLAEAVEADLLLARTRGRRFGRLGLQGPMHALVPSVLLRLARLDALQRDAGLDPADRQARQSARARSGEGCPVVRADGQRQAVAFEEPLDRHADRVGPGRDDDTGQKETAVLGVADGQRVERSPSRQGAEPEP